MVAPAALLAQSADGSGLELFGFRPGMPRAEAEARVREFGGSWRCVTSPGDARLSECRGTLQPPGELPLAVLASLVHDSVAVLLLSTSGTDDDLERWRSMLARRYGSVPPRRNHGQDSWQWVRQNRMIRLTTRREGSNRVVSASLVDGALLDGLGALPPA